MGYLRVIDCQECYWVGLQRSVSADQWNKSVGDVEDNAGYVSIKIMFDNSTDDDAAKFLPVHFAKVGLAKSIVM